jgi:phosphate transport system substrate-binding protein
MRKVIFILLIITIGLITSCKRQPALVSPSPGRTTSIVNKGSDTLVNLALAWAEAYHELNPNVEISVTGGGSGTGIAALINDTVDIANASRQITPDEIQQIKNNGGNPVEYVVARDAIAVIVNPSNPISQLTIQQISDIFSGKINYWSEIGGENLPIVRLSRETNSGTHVFFLQNVIRMGNPNDKTLFSTDTALLPSSEGITAEVRDNPNAIGYDGLGYVTPEVKVIAVAQDSKGPYSIPSADSVNNRQYPIARDLYMYTRDKPIGAVADYLTWLVTPQAQAIVKQLGFVPLVGP